MVDGAKTAEAQIRKCFCLISPPPLTFKSRASELDIIAKSGLGDSLIFPYDTIDREIACCSCICRRLVYNNNNCKGSGVCLLACSGGTNQSHEVKLQIGDLAGLIITRLNRGGVRGSTDLNPSHVKPISHPKKKTHRA